MSHIRSEMNEKGAAKIENRIILVLDYSFIDIESILIRKISF